MPPDKRVRDPLPAAAKVHYNRLINEKSPYLLQHAANPVDWYPWGDEAFGRALKEDKPVFLSIGYATCHWCHVMAHESFEDPGVAALLNKDFICIKVDREERPDIDSIYMSVCQMITGQGGWPLTIVVTPEKKPFFAGTYIPKESRHGMNGLVELLPRIIKLWQEKRGDLTASADEIASALQKSLESPGTIHPDASFLQAGYEELAARFDEAYGGFGSAPKFPTPYTLLFLLRFWKRTGTKHALAMVEKTLGEMRLGGICDQIGGGFHRYSTDLRWRVPHFEKMLYDQALLVMAYTEAYQATLNPQFRKTAEEIIAYVLRDLSSPDGAFFSAEDADSEGTEGAFYLWTMHEFEQILGKDDAVPAARYFNMTHAGNYPASADKLGPNILYRTPPSAHPESSYGFPDVYTESRLASIKDRLFTARAERAHPSLDDKILADWNGLFIAALAQAARIFRNETYLAAARRAMQFVVRTMHDENGGLLHRYRDGEAAIPAFGDDYAFVIKALIELYESTFDASYLSSALDYNARFLSHFWDDQHGGFFTVPDTEKTFLVRRKEIYDGAAPSCNSIALENLVRLAHLTGDTASEERGSELSRCFAKTVQQSPSAYSGFLAALDIAIGPVHDVVIFGNRDAPDTQDMINALWDHYLPAVIVHFLPADESRDLLFALAPFLCNLNATGNISTAHVCTGRACSVPTTETDQMLALLGCKPDK
jgi:uncharacterized protein YyaL (SSP411 family)